MSNTSRKDMGVRLLKALFKYGGQLSEGTLSAYVKEKVCVLRTSARHWRNWRSLVWWRSRLLATEGRDRSPSQSRATPRRRPRCCPGTSRPGWSIAATAAE